MFEKVSKAHPDKIADRISGAIVDLAYEKSEGGFLHGNPRIAVEVLLGHGKATVMIESSEDFREVEIEPIVRRLAGDVVLDLHVVRQDALLAENQEGAIRCGDNGVFRGCPPTHEQKLLTAIAASIYERWPYDGKYIINRLRYTVDGTKPYTGIDAWAAADITICQSNAKSESIRTFLNELSPREMQPDTDFPDNVNFLYHWNALINPLGEWTGGPDVDCGATNRKLGSDMGDGVTGGGLHGKDLSKGDVSINIVCFLKAVQSGQTVTACCSIGDEQVTFVYAGGKTETETFRDVVEMARLYILTDHQGSFERFAMWGLIAPKD